MLVSGFHLEFAGAWDARNPAHTSGYQLEITNLSGQHIDFEVVAKVTIPDNPNGGGDLKLVNGRWEMTKEISLMNCTPGQPDVTVVTSLDPATLQGTEVNTNHCLDNVITAPASLTPA